MLAYIVTGVAVNSDVFGGWNNRPPRHLSVVENPAETIMMGDNDVLARATSAPPLGSIGLVLLAHMDFSPCQDARFVTWHTRWGVAPSSSSGRLGAKHHEGGNFAYVDGHVKWLKTLPRNCSTWLPHPAVKDLVIPNGDEPPAAACRPPGQGVNWCTQNIH
jgi:prepilin-type processing-associated H-X9-DG protein